MKNLPRRQVLNALAAVPLAGLPLAAILADPRLARAAADSLEEIDITSTDGRQIHAALAMPATTPAPAIILIHEWWGLNDQIKSVAAEFAAQGYVALAVDLYNGTVAADATTARATMKAVKGIEATDTLTTWFAWLKAHQAVSGKIGTIGWCFGGGWSLSAAIATPADAAVVYYGRVTHSAAELGKLKGPVLGHFATRDKWIDKAMVSGFQTAMAEAGKDVTAHWYEADHAFANPTQARYDSEDARLAWARTLAFFKAQLMG